MSTPAGWYADPWAQAARRWWNGDEWSGYLAAAGSILDQDSVSVSWRPDAETTVITGGDGRPAGDVVAGAGPAQVTIRDPVGHPIFALEPGRADLAVSGPDGVPVGGFVQRRDKGAMNIDVTRRGAVLTTLEVRPAARDGAARMMDVLDAGGAALARLTIAIGRTLPPSVELSMSLRQPVAEPLRSLLLALPIMFRSPSSGARQSGAHMPGALEVFRGE